MSTINNNIKFDLSAFFSDGSARTAIDTLAKSERAEQGFVFGFPTRNTSLTGDELMGAVLEGVNDPGNEAQELRQMRGFIQSQSGRLNPSAERVAKVVEKYLGVAEGRPDGSLTQQEKTAMAKELAEAAKPQRFDKLFGEGGAAPSGINQVATLNQHDGVYTAAAATGGNHVATLNQNDGVAATPAATAFWAGGPFNVVDDSAHKAIETLKFHEGAQTLQSIVHGGPPNKTTGDELMGAVLEGTGDPGNEAMELRQLKEHAAKTAARLDDSGRRVAGVIDKYLAIAESRIGGSLTQAEKTQMAKDLAAAAKPRLFDDLPLPRVAQRA